MDKILKFYKSMEGNYTPMQMDCGKKVHEKNIHKTSFDFLHSFASWLFQDSFLETEQNDRDYAYWIDLKSSLEFQLEGKERYFMALKPKIIRWHKFVQIPLEVPPDFRSYRTDRIPCVPDGEKCVLFFLHPDLCNTSFQIT